MDDVAKTLDERGDTHGDFSETAYIAIGLKDRIRAAINRRKEVHRHCLLNTHQEALDLICTKIARILSGDPDEPDHWKDIEGYARLVRKELEE